MTREEELQQFAEQNTKGLYLDRHNLIQMVKQGAVWADQHPHWIPVEERLPEEENLYIVSNGKETSVAYWVEDAWDSFGDVITHWMPLPEAPQGKED